MAASLMMNDVCTLIAQTVSIDAYGDKSYTETSRQVFCGVGSVGAKEFYQAQAAGLQPEKKIVLADYLDYAGERYLEHDGVRYRVIRTYRDGIRLELTVTVEVVA